MPKGTTSPRRLSRVRQLPPPSQSTSVSSTTSSTRQERSTRSHHKASSPQKSSTPQSLASEDASEDARGGTSEPHQLRRSKRTHDADEDGDAKLEDLADDGIVEDDETTRCICGYLEYPGQPVDPTLGRSAKGSQPPGTDKQSDDRGGLFIQCDDCQVWQHGGCVSLMEESAVPDNYYCEECKPELHELLKSPNGQKFSHYLPVWSKSHPKTARKGSVDKDDKSKHKDRERLPRASALPETKRRSTMNSRAAYDEDEVLRKVLEESKTEGPASSEGGSRKGKRNRDDSEDVRFDIKRQRTASSVLSSHSGDASAAESENERSNTKRPLPRQAVPKGSTSIKAENKTTAAGGTTTVKRRGGRRNGGGGDNVVDNSNNAQASTEAVDDGSAAPSTARPSANASPVGESETLDTPSLSNANATNAGNKKGGKRPGAAGRGRSNPAPTPSERDDKGSPRNGNDDTPVPSVTINGTASKRGKPGQQKDAEWGESDRDHHHHNGNSNGGTAAQSDAEPPATTANDHNNSNAHPPTLAGQHKKKEPSMNELKRRTAAMLDWVEKAKEDLGRSNLVHLSLSPSSGSLSPPTAALGVGAVVGGVGGLNVRGELGSVAEMLHARLLGWQVEYGTG